MGASWFTEHWLDLVQTTGIVGGLVFTAYAVRKEERARRIGNLIAINGQYGTIWRELNERPELSRILNGDVNLPKEPVSDEEMLFVKMLILHLDTVRRAIEAGMFVKIKGLQDDIRYFFSLPIPKAVWEKIKSFQDPEFVKFVEAAVG